MSAPAPALFSQSTDTLARATNVPLPPRDDISSLIEPRPPFMSAPSDLSESPRDSYADSHTFLAPHKEEHGDVSSIMPGGPHEVEAASPGPSLKKKNRLMLAVIAAAALIVVILAVVLPVCLTANKREKTSSATTTSGHGGNNGNPSGTSAPGPVPTPTEDIWGGDGSTIRASDGTTFTYVNQFGGTWYSNPNDPYGLNAQPNSWTKPLNQSWDFETDRIQGVNLGGWFVLEPFISPEIFQRYPGAVDEWTLSVAMAADTANGGLSQLEEHYKTFITEQDIAMIAGAGLNWVRLPVPFWAIDKLPEEPFLEKVSWKYIVQALQWCRKYGLRVKLDLHTIPGSQNAYNHSGKSGAINFLMGVMGIANAQRALNYIRVYTQFISQPEWKNVVLMFGIMNEARIAEIGATVLRGFYVEAYKMIRGITGYGAGNGPHISLHEGFQGLASFGDFLPGADRMVIDVHPYFAFNGQPATEPMDTGVGPGAGGVWPDRMCSVFASTFNQSRATFGITISGEWSNGFNDCGLFLNGVSGGASYGGNCAADWEDSSRWTEGTKAGLMRFTMAQMDSFRDFFFWTWRIGESQRGIVEAPLWSYKAGLLGGWMPTDPRAAIGTCGPSTNPWSGTFSPWMKGESSPPPLDISSASVQYPFPPLSMVDGNPVNLMPTYTATGVVNTLPAPTYTDLAGNVIPGGDGWANKADTTLAPTPVQGCTYPSAWDARGAAVPPACGAGAPVGVPVRKREASPNAEPMMTPAPGVRL